MEQDCDDIIIHNHKDGSITWEWIGDTGRAQVSRAAMEWLLTEVQTAHRARNPYCGGCEGLSTHRIECPKRPGFHRFKVFARRANDMADSIGANCPEAANNLYQAAAWLDRYVDNYNDERGEENESDDPCEAFVWIGQPLSSCDVCGQPYWDHRYEWVSGGPGPFDADYLKPITPDMAQGARRNWGVR